MTRRSGSGRPKRLAAAVVAGWLLLVPATLAATGGRLFTPLAGAIADGSGLPGAGDLLAAVRTAEAGPEEYGASGILPESDTLSPELLAALAAGTAAPAESGFPLTGSGPLATVPPGPLGLPGVMLDAYVRAAETLATTHPNCGLHWSVLAAIGRIESGHASGGAVDARGTTVRPILGPVLSGGPGMAAIRDTDGGVLDGNTMWDRAVGPMQFIPSTWSRYAVDGNNDGVASPHNIYDATLAAGQYLCAGAGDLRDPVALAQAIFRYNHSEPYVANVLSWAAAYAAGVTPLPSSPAPTDPAAGLPPVAAPPTTTLPGTTPPASTTTTTTTTTAGSSSTTTPTCPTTPTSTDPSSTTPSTTPTTVPPGCETTTPPSSSTETSTEQTTTDPVTPTDTQSSSDAPSASTESATQDPSSADTSTAAGTTSDTSAATSAGAGAAETTTSLPPA